MADDTDKESKTEEATEKKIRDSLDKGQVPFAKEVTVVGSFLAILVFMVFLAESRTVELGGFLSIFIERRRRGRSRPSTTRFCSTGKCFSRSSSLSQASWRS